MDASATTVDAAVGTDREVDAALPLGCGTWKKAHKSDPGPPDGAEPYGLEVNDLGTFNQFVCRFSDTLDGRSVILQGKGVFGFACYAVLPAGATAPARVQPSDTFEVLAETKACAKMVPFEPSLRMLPTGVDVDGNRTFTCRGIVNSVDVPGQSMPLGRYDPVRKSCVFEWHQNVREAPRLEGESFEVLAAP